MKVVETPHLELVNLQKSYHPATVLDHLNLQIHKGEFIAIVGKSGCGKSTLLRLLAGLEQPSGGEIRVEGSPLTGLNREACMMFQDGRLLPWKRVLDNVRLGLKGDHREEAEAVLRQVGLNHKKDEWPAKLSGGQKQRVALARALIHKPSLLLLDEPLGALDALTRIEMQSLIEEIWSFQRFTSLLVTHDVEEAVSLADRVVLLHEGKITQDIPIPLKRPRKRDQSAFTSIVNFILGQILELPHNTAKRSGPLEGTDLPYHAVPNVRVSNVD